MASIAAERSFFLTSVGKKYIMAASGIIWAGFVAGHMAGNLLMFVGADAYNKYGHALTSGMLIYLIEAVLLSALAAHIFCAVSLTLENRKARGQQRYAATPNGEKAPHPGSTFMAIHGTVILAFIILHLITFKYGTYYETTVDGVVMRDLHRLLIEVFQSPVYVGWYLVSLVLLGFHLRHGVYSIFQSLGIKNRQMEIRARTIGFAYGALVAAGFLSQPIYIFLFNR